MSELDLNNIVGFKAIDADGNEQQVTVDEMVGLVSARIVSAASEISTFEAAAEAGTDEFEDQLTVSDTFSWLRTMDGSKNPTLTSSTAAAKVLGGLFTSLKLFPFMYKGIITNGEYLNELESGYYRIQNVSENTPTNTYYGILISIVCGDYIGQISIPSSNNALYIRIKDGTFGWKKWMKFTGVQI